VITNLENIGCFFQFKNTRFILSKHLIFAFTVPIKYIHSIFHVLLLYSTETESWWTESFGFLSMINNKRL